MTISSLSLSPFDLRDYLGSNSSAQLFDVRSYPEFAGGHLVGARLLPLDQVTQRLAEIDRTRPVVVVCGTGKRSAQAREALISAGFEQVSDLAGGLAAWEEAGLPMEKSARVPWSLERQVRVVAGSLVLLGVALGFSVHPAFFGLSAFIGGGLVVAGVTDWCGMGLLLARMPWNRASESCGAADNTPIRIHS
jgi:rhodanese-related sulfurtransferase